MKVYIIRHGEVPHNALKQYNNENEDLTKKGIKQAEELREKIKTIDYDIIICSPLIRAKHTAKIINVKEKEILIDNRLEERISNVKKEIELTNKKKQSIKDKKNIFKKYTHIDNLSIEVVNDFIDKIIVGYNDDSTNSRDLKIIWNFTI